MAFLSRNCRPPKMIIGNSSPRSVHVQLLCLDSGTQELTAFYNICCWHHELPSVWRALLRVGITSRPTETVAGH